MITAMRLRHYLDHIGISGALDATVDTLRRLHVAHREAFLFENLSIQTGGGVSLALADLEHKFLDQGRGGYCFEQNTLFAAVLRELGFATDTLLGRVRRGPPERWCRTHMVLRVRIDRDVWLADVGFGGLGLLEPIPLRDGAQARQVGFDYTLRREAHVWVLSTRDAVSTMDQYEFSEDPQTPWDVEVANHFTSTHPESVFRKTLTIQRTTRHERIVLRHDMWTCYREVRAEDHPIERRDLDRVVREQFGLTLPPGPFVFERYPSLQPAAVASTLKTD
jgi:N-hydroxyarylamine O-acetyltransferase